MPTGTAKKKTPPLTYEQIADRKLRDTLEEYRAIVERGAGGEMLPEADLERAVELLTVLRLPELSFKQHVTAAREYAAAVGRQAELEAAGPAERAELVQLNSDVERLLKLIEEKRLRAQALQYGETQLINAMRKQNELLTLYPDVVGPLDNAVSRRIAKRQAEAAAVPVPAGPSPSAGNSFLEGWQT
jgi:hypothetical protein